MNTNQPGGFIAFIKEAEQLKNVLRSAHTSSGRPESTAEHSWRLALFALALEDELGELDVGKVLKLCLVHDLGEALHGDVPATQQVAGSTDKSVREREDLAVVIAALPAGRREHIMALWDEYDAAHTPEARFVKGLDKLETIIQHNQGANRPDFDYAFNLDYGVKHTSAHPLLAAMRRLVDAETRQRGGLLPGGGRDGGGS